METKVRKPLGKADLFTLLLTLAATLILAPRALNLYRHLRTDFDLLLPADAPSVLDAETIRRRLPTTDSLVILIEGEPEKSLNFAQALSDRLGPRDRDEKAQSLTPKAFLNRWGPIYLPAPGLARLRAALEARLDYERKLHNPLNIFSGVELREPMIPDPVAELERILARKGISSRQLSGHGALSSRDGRLHALEVPLEAGGADMDAIRRLRDHVNRSIEQVSTEQGGTREGLQIHFTGNVQNTWEEHESITRDLHSTSGLVLLLVAVSMAFFLPDIRVNLALFLALGVSVLWTFGITSFWTRELNANSAFLGSILIGNGINPGIIQGARYLYLRQCGIPGDIIQQAVRDSWRPTLLAALCGALAYGALLKTEFRGFNQFGSIGFCGMLLSWLAAMTVQPALLRLFTGPGTASRSHPSRSEPGAGAAGQTGLRKVLSAVLLAAAVTSLGFLLRADWRARLETDLSQLRSQESFESGSAFWSKKVDELTGRYLSPMGILTDSRVEARKLAARIRTADPEHRDYPEVFCLDDLIPGTRQQIQTRQSELRLIRKLLPPWRVARLPAHERRRLEPFLRDALLGSDIEKQIVAELPRGLLRFFQEKDGTIGRIVWVAPPLESTRYSPAKLDSWVSNLRNIAHSIAPGAALAGTLPLTRDLLAGVERDAPRASLIAALAVSLLILLISIRHPFRGAALLLTLGTGVSCLGGWVLFTGIRLHFLNFIAIPITLGIGADYGINMMERLVSDAHSRNAGELISTRRAVILCSLTTLIGYGSLLMADNRAIRSFGLICVAGEITCLLAAILVLPSLMEWGSTLGGARTKRHALRKQGDRGRIGHAPERIEHIVVVKVDGRESHARKIDAAHQAVATHLPRDQQRQRRIRHMKRRHRSKHVS
jgi:predicted exporter